MKNLESEIMDSLIIKDPIYGEFEINEPVLIELINSKPLQRLKKIGQHGWVVDKLYFKSFTRYDHSIGVMLLLRKLGASLEEQIAGLLHDVSHTAFSHVADYLYGTTGKDDYQDSILEEFILRTKIPKILNKYGLNLDQIEYNSKYTLLELDAPEVCVDRYDYSMRESFYLGFEENVKYILNHTINYKNKLVFDNFKSVELFVKYYCLLNKTKYGAPHDMLRYELTAQLLKYAKDKKIITLKDLNKTDEYIFEKLINSNDEYILKQITIPQTKLNVKLVYKNQDYFVKNKFRYVDPKFLDKNKTLVRYSQIKKNYLQKIQKQKIKHEKGYKIKLIN